MNSKPGDTVEHSKRLQNILLGIHSSHIDPYHLKVLPVSSLIRFVNQILEKIVTHSLDSVEMFNYEMKIKKIIAEKRSQNDG